MIKQEFIVASGSLLISLVSLVGSPKVAHIDSKGNLVNIFSDDIYRTRFSWVTPIKMVGSGTSVVGFGLLFFFYQAQIRAINQRASMPISDDIEENIREEGRIERLRGKEKIKTDIALNQYPIDLKIAEFAQKNNLPLNSAKRIYLETIKRQKETQQNKQIEQQKAISEEKKAYMQRGEELAKTFMGSGGEMTPEAIIEMVENQDLSNINTMNNTVNNVNSELGFHIGKDQSNGTDFFWKPLEQDAPYIWGVGGTGAGKTTLIKKLYGQVIDKNINTLFISFHPDTAEMAGSKTVHINDDNCTGTINPFAVFKGLNSTINRVVEEIKDISASSGHALGVQQKPLLKEILAYLYRDAGVTTDKDTWANAITPNDLIMELKHIYRELTFEKRESEYTANIRVTTELNTVQTLLGRISDIYDHVFFQDDNRLNIKALCSGNYVISMHNLSHNSTKYFLANCLLTQVSYYMETLPDIANNEGFDRINLFLFSDECSILFTPNLEAKKKKNNPSNPIVRMTSEHRKYGLAQCHFSQENGHFPNAIFKQFDTAVTMKLKPYEHELSSKITGIPIADLQTIKGRGDCFIKTLGGLNRVQVS